MKKVIFCFCLSLLSVLSCKKEIAFDDHQTVDSQIKKYINEYKLITIDQKYNYALSIQRKLIGDTIEFVVYANNSIAVFESKKVYFHAKYLGLNIFSNYRNSSFHDSCGLEVAAQYLDKEEYEYFLKEKKVPAPFTLINIMHMKLVFANNKLIKKYYYY